MNIPLKLSIATVVLGSLVAVTLASATTPRAASNSGLEVSVNRAGKGDRLGNMVAKSAVPTAPQHSSMSAGPRPIGCDLAFSPLAEPGRKRVFGRCVS